MANPYGRKCQICGELMDLSNEPVIIRGGDWMPRYHAKCLKEEKEGE
jgi:hypothetical protein